MENIFAIRVLYSDYTLFDWMSAHERLAYDLDATIERYGEEVRHELLGYYPPSQGHTIEVTFTSDDDLILIDGQIDHSEMATVRGIVENVTNDKDHWLIKKRPTIADIADRYGIPRPTLQYARLTGNLRCTMYGEGKHGCFLVSPRSFEQWYTGYLLRKKK